MRIELSFRQDIMRGATTAEMMMKYELSEDEVKSRAKAINLLNELNLNDHQGGSVPMKIKTKLKLCPFCGGKARLYHIPENTLEDLIHNPGRGWKDSGMWTVGCEKDHSCIGNYNHKAMVFFTKDEAIIAWNRRAGE